MANKTADAIKLNLRLPKPLHKRLKQQARRNNVSLNTEIVNQLSNPKDPRIPFYVSKENPLKNLLSNVDAKAIATEIANQLPIAVYSQKEIEPLFRDVRGLRAKMETFLSRGLPEPVPFVIMTDLEAAKTRIVALEDEVAHLRGQAESERRVQDTRAVLEREKGEEQK